MHLQCIKCQVNAQTHFLVLFYSTKLFTIEQRSCDNSNFTLQSLSSHLLAVLVPLNTSSSYLNIFHITFTTPSHRDIIKKNTKEKSMKNSYLELPKGYSEIFQLDLQKDKKTALFVNIFALVISAVMVVAGIFIVPITTFFDFSNGILMYLIKLTVAIAAMIIYLILHELVHGIFMKGFSKTKVHYGFTGLYAYAGSNAYFCKKAYIIIALAPIVVWGVVLLIINCFVDASWFWCVYFIQIMNISGAAGDLFVTYKFSKMPSDILVQDSGVSMKVYSQTK